ncbi:hypothetical protein JX265_001123 [Neoarthrinium moseri]|uniref:Uncharacterized protein n=1 Tax=Neoarthrinium moseri TaxID=1658444 RepID=A0A9P9WXG3_9PEZI|nr:hypothetical protein JX265_001123 [Neoarthrinium moseri]
MRQSGILPGAAVTALLEHCGFHAVRATNRSARRPGEGETSLRGHAACASGYCADRETTHYGSRSTMEDWDEVQCEPDRGDELNQDQNPTRDFSTTRLIKQTLLILHTLLVGTLRGFVGLAIIHAEAWVSIVSIWSRFVFFQLCRYVLRIIGARLHRGRVD